MQIGYMNDLSYYYLGRAAENLGYLQAAERYYRISERLSVTQMSCHQSEVNIANLFGTPANICDGYTFPDALYPHLQSVEARLAALNAPPPPTHRSKSRTARRAPSQTPASTSPATQSGGSGFVEPAPSAGAASSQGSGFVEPMPASSDFFAPPPVRH